MTKKDLKRILNLIATLISCIAAAISANSCCNNIY